MNVTSDILSDIPSSNIIKTVHVEFLNLGMYKKCMQFFFQFIIDKKKGGPKFERKQEGYTEELGGRKGKGKT